MSNNSTLNNNCLSNKWPNKTLLIHPQVIRQTRLDPRFDQPGMLMPTSHPSPHAPHASCVRVPYPQPLQAGSRGIWKDTRTKPLLA